MTGRIKLTRNKHTPFFFYTCDNAQVICNHVPPRAGDSGGIAGLKYHDFTFEVSRYCRGYNGLLIPAKTAREIVVGFYRVLSGYSVVF